MTNGSSLCSNLGETFWPAVGQGDWTHVCTHWKIQVSEQAAVNSQSRSDAKYSCLDRHRFKGSPQRDTFNQSLWPSAELLQSWILKAFLSSGSSSTVSLMGETAEVCAAVRSLRWRTEPVRRKTLSVASCTEKRKTTAEVLLCPPSLFSFLTPRQLKSLAIHHVDCKLMVVVFSSFHCPRWAHFDFMQWKTSLTFHFTFQKQIIFFVFPESRS